jgi:formylmethanofuran dehydrogenase subunit E
MFSKTAFLGMCVLTSLLLKDEPLRQLPQPRYEHKESDPAWLEAVVRFHGHLGPSIVAGARLGMAGLRAVGAKGYFDVEVTCEGPFAKPSQSCFLDGLQVGTGATLGKRNLHYIKANEIVIRLKNTSTGVTAEIRPTPKLLELLGFLQTPGTIQTDSQAKETAHQHDDMERIEALARKIADTPDEELFTVKLTP